MQIADTTPITRPNMDIRGDLTFRLHIPVASIAGRGADLPLNLIYDSDLWVDQGQVWQYGQRMSWPAAGWSLGFGCIRRVGQVVELTDSEGQSHTAIMDSIGTGGGSISISCRTTDGSFIRYGFDGPASGLGSATG